MTKHRIAVIVAGIDQSYQSAILEGMRTSAAGCGLDISVFASFSGTMGNPRHDTGEFNIFRLPDFSNFDGAVLLTNTIDYPPVVSDIITRIRQAKIPAVCIDNDIPDMLYIGIDNRTAMRRITEHFIKVHGFTDICYISGPADNPESADRLGA
ncbi:MAG TPA: arabinogalactan endo-1,4-beta-galactosidase, partial [Ruminococcus sp.]|nr:arabinogalactan endo-1,4-beta-galactosidase [Ruminococcus sp.]